MVTFNFNTKVYFDFEKIQNLIKTCEFSRPEPDTEAQNQDTNVDNSKPPDYFEDLPPTYEEAMRMKNQEETSTKVTKVF